jgi:zinc protease
LAEERESIAATTCQDVADYYARIVQPQSLAWAAVGDFDVLELREQLLGLLSDWPVTGQFERIVRSVQAVDSEEFVVPVDDKPNAAFFAGGALPLRADDPLAPALMVANEILGGSGLSSRLGQRIRQQEGMSYTVASQLRLSRFSAASPFTVYAIAAPENRQKFWSILAEVMQQWLQEGPTAEEVSRAKTGFLQAMLRRRNDDYYVLSTLLELLDTNRQFSDYMAEEQAIGAVGAEAISEASRRFWAPQGWAYVTAGSFGRRAKGEGRRA